MSFGGDKSIQNIVGVGVGRRELPFHTYRVSVWVKDLRVMEMVA
jgi:hypothetical protein